MHAFLALLQPPWPLHELIPIHWTPAAFSLAAGMVVTIEPGIYIAEENIGVRIEDMILITGNGARLMSGALPREVKEIEKALARRK